MLMYLPPYSNIVWYNDHGYTGYKAVVSKVIFNRKIASVIKIGNSVKSLIFPQSCREMEQRILFPQCELASLKLNEGMCALCY